MAKKNTLTVKVTTKHINKGNPQDAESCPIALALTDQGFLNVSVDVCGLEFSEELVSPRFGTKVLVQYNADMPEKGRRFVQAFDDLEDVKPVSITLRNVFVEKGEKEERF